jgi:hypothetical protein
VTCGRALPKDLSRRGANIPDVNARQDIVDGLADEEVQECMLQMLADNTEHRRREHSETPDTVENAIRPLVVKLKLGTEPRESLLAELFMRYERGRI